MVTSIGNAKPRIAVAVAHGLGIPIDKALQAIYRAPSVLVGGMAAPLAERLCTLLAKAGLGAEIAIGEVAFEPAELFDVALHIREPGSAYALAEAVADFCACDTARALTLLTTPPGVVLGTVSASTVDALRRHLPEGAADLVASNPLSARYVLIYSGDSRTVRAQLQDMLAARGLGGQSAGDVLATDLDHAEGQHVWATFGRTGSIRIVNRDFLRFEIWLDGVTEGIGTPATRAAALETLAGIPAASVAQLLGRTPFVLEDGIGHAALEESMRRYSEAGLGVRAELTTFQSVALEVVAARDGEQLASALQRLGLGAGLRPPFVTGGMPEARARIVRAVLEAAGAEAYFAEAAYG
ncbi:MAG TPA: hypothetical protein VFZ91_02285 [Allosphingosinicella sp.]